MVRDALLRSAPHHEAELVCDWGDGVQWPKERKPIFSWGCGAGGEAFGLAVLT